MTYSISYDHSGCTRWLRFYCQGRWENTLCVTFSVVMWRFHFTRWLHPISRISYAFFIDRFERKLNLLRKKLCAVHVCDRANTHGKHGVGMVVGPVCIEHEIKKKTAQSARVVESSITPGTKCYEVFGLFALVLLLRTLICAMLLVLPCLGTVNLRCKGSCCVLW